MELIIENVVKSIDSIRGFSGEINCRIKLQNFSVISNIGVYPEYVTMYNTNKITEIPNSLSIVGFVSATVTDEDPEYHWSDTFRSQRTSNEAKVRILYRIGGKLRRQLGKRVSMMNGNCVIGLKQSFMFEAEDGKIMGRAIGTVIRVMDVPEFYKIKQYGEINENKTGSIQDDSKSSSSMKILGISSSHKTTPNTSCSSSTSSSSDSSSNRPNLVINMRSYPHNFLSVIGGIVSAVSFKKIEDDSARTREIWWENLRNELISHSRFLFCDDIVGYIETCCAFEDMMILHCMGTAANVNPGFVSSPHFGRSESAPPLDSYQICKVLHAPYDHRSAPYPMKLRVCNTCNSGYVPNVLFTTIELPKELTCTSHSEYLEAYTSYDMNKRLSKSSSHAGVFSAIIPFIHYEFHRQLTFKMRLFGFNAVHCLSTQITISGSTIMSVTSGTGICLQALPILPTLELKSSDFISLALSPSDFIDRVSSIRSYITADFKNFKHISHCSSTTSTTSSLSASACVRDSGTVVINIDEEPLNNSSSLVLGFVSSKKFKFLSSSPPSISSAYNRPTVLSVVKCFSTSSTIPYHEQFAVAVSEIFEIVSINYSYMDSCIIYNINCKVTNIRDKFISLILTGAVIDTNGPTSDPSPNWISPNYVHSQQILQKSSAPDEENDVSNIVITPSSNLPNTYITKYIGRLCFHLVREAAFVYSSNNISKFQQRFMTEVYAIIKAHVASLGGNAFYSYSIDHAMINNNPKTHGHAILSVSGDAVCVEYK